MHYASLFSPLEIGPYRLKHRAKGGLIFLQLWHVGRVSHSSFQPGCVPPVAPSAVPIAGLTTMTAQGKPAPYETPRALETDEIASVVDCFDINSYLP